MNFSKLGNVIFQDKKYEFGELRARIDKISKYIKKRLDFDDVVAIAVNRDENLICLIFALIESNVTFLPIDTKLPKNRIEYMLEQAKIKNIIVSEEKQDGIYGNYGYIHFIDLFENSENAISEHKKSIKERPVYILYTSGTTGNPKAVVVTLTGFENFIKAVPTLVNFSKNKTIACFTTFCFDIFFLESVLGLSLGMTVVLASEDEQNNPKGMIKLIKKHQIDVLQMTPSRMKLLIMYTDSKLDFMSSVKTVLLGGEKVTIDLVSLLKEYTMAKIYNMYGPAETTIWSTISNLTESDTVDIGKPVGETSLYIVDEKMFPVMEGELLIGGKGVALGYYNQPKLTAERFVQLPFAPFEKVYRTGDIVKQNENGQIIYVGRKDSQVKIMGYRIELEEIEKAINKVDGILSSVVCAKNDELVCFYICKEEVIEQKFRKVLSDILPHYMLPARYRRVEKFQYTVSGKTDRRAMLDIEKNQVDIGIIPVDKGNKYEESSIENKVLNVFEQIVNHEGEYGTLSLKTKMNSIAINSINYVQIVVKLEDSFDIEFEDVYLGYTSFDTLRDIADYIKKRKWLI